MAIAGIIAFGNFELDQGRGELRRSGAVVHVEPQVLDLIGYLALHPGEVVTRDDLIAHVWDGRIVSDSAIASRINSARAALGDDGTAQKVIKTIPRRGFRFEAEVRSGARAAPALPDKPSVAVLRFQNMSGDPEQSYFSDGMTDDIITELSRHDELFVIARHSSFAYRDSSLPPAAIAAELGVQYIAEGSVRRAGDRIRVTAQLIDPRAGQQIWAERYDRELTDIFEVQDEITGIIVNTLAGQIARQHYRRVAQKSGDAVAAYDHLLRASEHAIRVAPDDNRLAREEALRALAIEPGLARARSVIALTYVNEANNFWVPDQEEAMRQGFEAARAAVVADGREAWAHVMLGISELWLNRSHERAEASMRQALALNPGHAQIRGLCSYVLAFTGAPDAALREIDIAIRQNPHFPPLFHGFRGRALLMLRRIEEAVENLDQMAAMMPGHSNALGYAAAAHAALGDTERAEKLVERLCRSNRYYRLSALRRRLPFRDPADLAFVVDNLERAGLPEA